MFGKTHNDRVFRKSNNHKTFGKPFINRICKGDGVCLDIDNRKMDDILCDYDCRPYHCPNHLVCKTPPKSKFILKFWDYMCPTCFLKGYGKLDIKKEKKECIVCMEEKIHHVKFPNCDHRVCNVCFRRQYFGKDKNFFDIDEEDEIFVDESNLRRCVLCRK